MWLILTKSYHTFLSPLISVHKSLFKDSLTAQLMLCHWDLPIEIYLRQLWLFSPGYIFFPSGTSLDTLEAGKTTPRIFFSHGTDDQVLQVNYCSRRITQNLKRCGFEHHYLEFTGGHTITVLCIDEALKYCCQKPKESTKEVVVVKETSEKIVKVIED